MTTMLAPIMMNEQHEQAADDTQRMLSAVQGLHACVIDAKVPTPALRAEVVDGDNLPVGDHIRLVAQTPQGPLALRVLDGAHDQLAQRLEIDRKFYNRLLAAHPDLLAHNITELLRREPDQRMLRMLQPRYSDDLLAGAARTQTQLAIRAIVSAGYLPLDNGPLADTLMPAAVQHGLRLVEWNLDERNFAMRFAGPERTLQEVRMAHGFKADGDNYHAHDEQGKDRAWVNEVLSFGVAITNSETGHGSLSVRQYSRILRCLNAFVKDETHRTRHIGKRGDDADDFAIAGADTRRLEAGVRFLKVRDRFIEAVSETRQRAMAEKFAEAMGVPLDIPAEVPMMQFIDAVGARFELSDRETEILQNEVVQEQLASGVHRPTAFTIAQGFTAAAKQLGDGSTFKRKQELEVMGWQIIEDPTNTLIRAAQDALKAQAKRN